MAHQPADTPHDAAASASASESSWPGISVVMPVLNEEEHLASAVERVMTQPYPGEVELIMAVGPSTDRTADIAAALTQQYPNTRVVENPTGKTPRGLNLAIGQAKHPVIVRVDGHGELGERYLITAVEVLQRTGAANVGGVMDARGKTPFQQAAACAYTTRLGLGGGAFHHDDSPEGEVDTVFLGVFRADALRKVGGFDEEMFRAQDWELNHRLRKAGEKVWFTPKLTVAYYPRSSPAALLRQFYLTGKWRRELIRRHPESASLRYLAPPLAVLGLTVTSVLGLIGLVLPGSIALRSPLRAALVVPLTYLGAITAGSLFPKDLPLRARAWLPAVYAMMHLAWGAGYLVGLSEHERQATAPPA